MTQTRGTNPDLATADPSMTLTETAAEKIFNKALAQQTAFERKQVAILEEIRNLLKKFDKR